MSCTPHPNKWAQEQIFSRKLIKYKSETIGLLRKCGMSYQYFVGPRLDYGDVIYDQTYKFSFYKKLESI